MIVNRLIQMYRATLVIKIILCIEITSRASLHFTIENSAVIPTHEAQPEVIRTRNSMFFPQMTDFPHIRPS